MFKLDLDMIILQLFFFSIKLLKIILTNFVLLVVTKFVKLNKSLLLVSVNINKIQINKQIIKKKKPPNLLCILSKFFEFSFIFLKSSSLY
jgi:hypothetical protein